MREREIIKNKIVMWSKIKTMREDEGYSKSKIARVLGIHRDTVAKYLLMSESEYVNWLESTGNRACKLDVYVPFVRSLLERDATLSGTVTHASQGVQFDGKDGVGGFAYGGTNPYAVTALGPDNAVAGILTDQSVAYTPFDKVRSVTQNGRTLTVDYGIDRQRVVQTIDDGNSRRAKRHFTPLYETVTENGVTKKMHYLTSASGLFAIFVGTSNNGGIMYHTIKDHQGSLAATVHGNTVERLSYDPWGRRRNTTNFGYDNVSHTFDRGFTGHEHLYDFDLINMNGRMYDPVMSGFLSVDQHVQSPGNSQNFNRYAYCLNNPLRYVDPDGEEFLTSAIIIGSLLVGAYSGGVLTNGGEYNPIKWDWSSSNTYDGMLLGGVFGGLSGFAGVSIAGMGFAFCNTASIATSSLFYSTGMHWTGKCTNFDYGISLGIGVASFDFTHGKLGYLGKRGNSTLQNIGFGFGALANLQDLVAGFNGTKIQVKSRKELAGHSELGEYSNNGIYQDGDILVSVGPNVRLGSEDQAVIQAMRNKNKL